MTPMLDAALRSWPWEPALLIGLLVTAVIYLRGWRVYHRRDPARWHPGQPAAFLGGLAALGLALASPIEPFSALLLSVHMVQHLLLMMVVPPLVWLGAPLLPVLRGLPAPVRSHWVGPLFGVPALRWFAGWLVRPATAWMLFIAATWIWHVPAVYDLALRSPALHYLQHACFLGSGLLFWYPVVRPFPFRPRWSLWLLVPYLLLADVSNTALAALLAFSDRVIYPYYADVPQLAGGSPLTDQAAAGVLMWVPGSVAFLLPLAAIGLQLMFKSSPPLRGGATLAREPDKAARCITTGEATAAERRTTFPGRIPLPLVTSCASAGRLPDPAPGPGFDLLRMPLLGRFLRWRYARPALQLPLLVLAVAVIVDGLTGPAAAPMNLAGVLPWIHWRGLLILGLLVAGNVFCAACPFMLPRALARRYLPSPMAWPRRLRNKWLAVGLVTLFLWAYEALALWDSPWLTAWIIVAYFATALVVDGLFRGAPFCKYVCPIGQFNFVLSLLSPLGVVVRDPEVCKKCQTKDCIRGSADRQGCELGLYLPRKAGNLDCTLCLDCVHACPHDNIAIAPSSPGSELAHPDRPRAGVGRFARRPDLAVLVIVLTAGAFANAAGMTEPVVAWQQQVAAWAGLHPPIWTVTGFFLLALVAAPVLLVGGAATASRAWGHLPGRRRDVAVRFTYALVPLGFTMWLSHYCFHFLTGYDTVVPVVQRFLADHRWAGLSAPEFVPACCRPVGAWLLKLELLVLDQGLLLSFAVGYRIARSEAGRSVAAGRGRALRAFAPWAALLVLLFAAGVWVMCQTMQMRGVMAG
jgi:cytochrome c oxidase assembly factor CtaG/polyferredoxin